MLRTFRSLLTRKPKVSLLDGSENGYVRHVATALQDRKEFERRAAEAADALGANAINTLVKLLHGEHTPPDALASQFGQLGAWLTARQFAIFEIFFCLGAPSVPTLLTFIHGEYDWPQGNAIEVLCRLFAKGIAPASAFDELKQAIPSMREETLLYAAGPLHMHLEADATLHGALTQLVEIREFADAYQRVLIHKRRSTA